MKWRRGFPRLPGAQTDPVIKCCYRLRLLQTCTLIGLLLLPASFALATEPRLHESEYLLSPWYRGEALPGLVPAILPKGPGAPLILFSEVLHAMGAEYEVDDEGSVRGRRHPGSVPFELMATGEWRLGNQQRQLSPGEYRWLYNELYISTELFAHLYPASLEIDLDRQRLLFKADGPLPMDLARERERLRNRLLTEAITDSPPKAEFPYRPVGRIAGDLNLDYYRRSLEPQNVSHSLSTLDYDGLLVSEFAYNTGVLFFRGDRENLTDARLRLGRESPDGNIWGVPGLTSGYLGDVNGTGLPLVGALSGRGGVVGNHPLNRPDQFDQTTLEGDAPAGWEVELYRGPELVAFGQVKPDGRYRFEDVPLLFGRNNFRVIFIGPQGQLREKSRTYTVGNNITKPGEIQWRLFAGEHRRRLLESALPEPLNEPTIDRQVYSLEGDLGLGRYASAGLFASRAPANYLDDAPLFDTQGMSTRISLPAVGLELDAATQTASSGTSDRGTAWGLGGSTGLGPLSLTWRHNEYDNFYSRRATYGAAPLASESRVRASLPINVKRQSLTLFGSGERWLYPDSSGESATRVGARFRLGRLHLNQELEARQFWDGPYAETQRRVWRPGASMSFGRLRLSLDGRYDLDVNEWRNTQLLGNWRFSNRTNLSVSAHRKVDLLGEPDWTGSFSLSQDFDHFRVRAFYSHQHEGGYFAGLGLNVSFGMNRRGGLHFSSAPWAERGSADIRVYHDVDNSGSFNRHRDQLIPGAQIQLSSQRRGATTTNDRGRVFVGGLNTREALTLQIVPESIPDPFLTPAGGGITFTPRPGQPYPAEIALVDSGEISGRVLAERNGVTLGLASVSVELERLQDSEATLAERPLGLSEDLLASAYIDGRSSPISVKNSVGTFTYAVQQSQYDGSYLFDRVPPGDYRVRLQSGQSINDSALESIQTDIRISPDNLYASTDLRLLAPDDEQRRPELLAQRIRNRNNPDDVDDTTRPADYIHASANAQLVMGSFRDIEYGWTRANRIVEQVGRPVWLIKVTLRDGIWYRVVTTRISEGERDHWENALHAAGIGFWILTEMSAHYEIISRVDERSAEKQP